MSAVEDQPAPGATLSREGDVAPPQSADVGDRRMRPWREPATWAVVLVVAMVWTIPKVGLVLAAGLGAALTPYGRRLENRAAVFTILVTGSVAIVVGLAGARVEAGTLQAIASALVLVVVAVNRLALPRSSRLPTVGLSTGLVVVTFASVLWAILAPFRGASEPQVLSGLIGGWDHSSHFAVLAGIHQQEIVDFVAHDGSVPMFTGYPSLHAQIWALLTDVLWGGAGEIGRRDLLVPYTVLSGATVALACALLVAVASDAARRISTRASGDTAALAAGVSSLALLFLGPATWAFNTGHVNFLLGIGMLAATAWYAGRTDRPSRAWGVALLALGTLALALLYFPLVLGLLISGVLVARSLVPGGVRSLILIVGGSLVVGAMVLGLAGIDPLSLVEQVQAYARWPGGYPPLNLAAVLVAPAAAVGLIVHMRRAEARAPVLAVLSAPIGLGLAALAFAIASVSQGLLVFQSYYTMKLAGGLAMAVSLLLCILLGLWFTSYVADVVGRPTGRARVWTAMAWVGLFAVVVPAAGYFGPKSQHMPAGSPVSSAGQAYLQRKWLVTEVPEGALIIGASDVLDRSDALPILWDGGELKNNVWVSSLQWQMSMSDHALVTSLPVPFDAKAAAFLAAWLEQDPTRKVQIAYLRPESRAILDGLAQAHPGQVTLAQIVM